MTAGQDDPIRLQRRDTVALLFENDVALPSVVAKVRELRDSDRAVVIVRRSGKLPSQITRLGNSGVRTYMLMRGDGTLEEKALGE